MAHAPELPDQFVCENCQTVHAGTPVGSTDGEHQFEPPESCGACGGPSLVRAENWVHHD